jgi:predicted PurR-regulated permease PerM
MPSDQHTVSPFKIPFYAKTALIAISLFAFVYTMYLGSQIIIPIVFGTILAILLNPLVNFLISHKIHKIISISIAVLLAILMVLGILYIVSSQITMFSETFPQLKAKFNSSSNEFTHWISHKFNIRISKINTWTKETQSDAIDNFELGERLTEAGGILVTLMLLPAYLFMILYYKPLLLDFIRRLFALEHHVAVAEILMKTKKIIQSYLVGLFFEMVIIATLSSAALLLLGIEYALVLGITGAILNIIPYIGGIIAIALPMIIAFVTKESSTYALLVFIIYIFIQFIDNHYIIPKIVASRVKINALISVVVILIGSAIWGIPGMFLSIPMTAIFKVIFDHVEPLKPWGFLLGNIVPTSSRFSFIKHK